MGTPSIVNRSRSLVCLLLLSALVAFVGVVAADTPPPASGDWVVSDTTSVSGTDIELFGNLTVTSGGQLTLHDLDLTMNLTEDHGTGIYVEAGARLDLGFANIRSSDPDLHFWFEIWGIANITNCDVQDVASNLEELTNWSTIRGGVQIYNSNSIVVDSAFHDCQRINMYVKDADPVIVNSEFYNAEYVSVSVRYHSCGNYDSPYDDLWINVYYTDATGLYLEGADPTILECNFRDNGLPSTALRYYDQRRSMNGVETHGRGILAHESSPLIKNCSLIRNGGQPTDLWQRYFFDNFDFGTAYEGGLVCVGSSAHPRVMNANISGNNVYGVLGWSGGYPALLENVDLDGNWHTRPGTGDTTIYRPSAAIYLYGGVGDSTVRNVSLSANYVWSNVYLNGPSLTLSNFSNTDNKCTDPWSANIIAEEGYLTIVDSSLDGEGLHANVYLRYYYNTEGKCWIENCTLTGGMYGVYGGGRSSTWSHIKMRDTTVTGATEGNLRVWYAILECLNCTVYPLIWGDVSDSVRARVYFNYYVNIDVVWSDGTPIQEALVEVVNVTGVAMATGFTDASGRLGPLVLRSQTFILGHRKATPVNNTPITVNVTIDDKVTTSGPHDFKGNLDLEVIILDYYIPHIQIIMPLADHGQNDPLLRVMALVVDNESGVSVVQFAIDGSSWEDMQGQRVWKGSALLDEGVHSLTVRARDGAGNVAMETVDGIIIDITPPEIHILQPQELPLITNATMVTINGSTEPIAKVYLDGTTEVPTVDGDFTLEVVLGADGLHGFLISAYDEVGNLASVLIPIFRDTTPPLLRIEYPLPDLLTNLSSVEVTGFVQGATALWIQGTSVEWEGGRYSHEATLTEGENFITVQATDDLDNMVTVQVNVTCDLTPPEVILERPLDGEHLNTLTTVVEGSVDADATGLFINGFEVAIISGTFEETIDLGQGTNSLLIQAIDSAGNIWHGQYSLLVDIDPPSLWIESPVDGAIIASTFVMVTGGMADGVGLEMNGEEVMVTDEFHHLVQLDETPPGGEPNIIEVVAWDEAGNEAWVVLHITRDTVAPELSVGQVPETTKEAQINLSGSVGDVQDIAQVLVNGWHVDIREDGTFTALLTLSVGLNEIQVMAVDHADNEESKWFMVERTEAPPAAPETEEGSASILLIVLVVAFIAGIGAMMVSRYLMGTKGGD